MMTATLHPALSRSLPFALLLLSFVAAPARAADVDFDTEGKPEQVCLNTEKNLRMVMNIWASGASDTYAEVKPDIEKNLSSHGERGAKLIGVYKAMIPRIEQGEFMPPNVVSRYEGHQKLRAETHLLCMKALAS